MGWNGSGVVTRDNGTNSGANTWENDRDASIKITAENHDTHDQDLADAIQNTIAKDGQNFPTADLPMNNQKHTGVGAATVATHYARADQVQNGAFIWGGTAAGTADAITFNLTPTLTAYTTGLTVRFLANGTTTVTNPTININAAGAKTVKDQDGNALSVGDIASGTVYEAVYDGTDFRVYVVPSDYVTGPASATDSAVALYDGTGGKTLKNGPALGTAANNIPQLDSDGLLSASVTFPVGIPFWWPANTPPSWALECDGSAISRTTYADLFAVIGTTFGTGDGSTTFNIPDLRGEFIRGWDNGRGVDSGRVFGSAQSGQIEAHTHGISDQNLTFVGGGVSVSSAGPGAGKSSTSTGGSETRPRNVAFLPCIKY